MNLYIRSTYHASPDEGKRVLELGRGGVQGSADRVLYQEHVEAWGYTALPLLSTGAAPSSLTPSFIPIQFPISIAYIPTLSLKTLLQAPPRFFRFPLHTQSRLFQGPHSHFLADLSIYPPGLVLLHIFRIPRTIARP